MKAADKIDPKAQEHESRRIGLQDRLAEKVVDTKHDSQPKGAEVALKDLKAVFFVKAFRGNSKYKESQKIAEGKPGRKIEVTFSDGEKIVGTTQAYNPKSKGFFVYPADAKSNSLRIFVVNWNVRDVKFL